MNPWIPVGLILLTVSACRSAPRDTQESVQPAPTPGAASPAGQGATGGPVLLRLAPDSVRLDPRIVTEVVLTGRGFATANINTVRIGPIELTKVPANATGTEIRVVVPARYTTNAEAPPRPLFPGSYPVTVETNGKNSASIMLKVIS